MATVPAHIKVARKQGALAGLTQLHEYLARNTNNGTNGLDSNIAMLDEIEKAGKFRTRGRNAGTFAKPEKAVAWYCNHFAAKFGTDSLPTVIEPRKRVTRVAQPVEEPEVEETTEVVDIQAIVAAAVAAAMGVTPAPVDSDEDDDEDEDDDDENDGTEVVQGTRVRRVVRQTEQTSGYPAPRDPDANATNGKLWTLNTEGPDFGYFLVVIDEEGNIVAGGDEPLNNGECHELIAEIRA